LSLNVVGTVRDTSSINKFDVEKVISVKVPIETKVRVVWSIFLVVLLTIRQNHKMLSLAL